MKVPSKDNYPNNTGLSDSRGYHIEFDEPAEEDQFVCSLCGGSGYRVCSDCNGSGKLDKMFQGVLRTMEHGRCVR